MRWEKIILNTPSIETPGGKRGRGRPPRTVLGPGKRWGHTCNSVQGGKLVYVFGGYSKDTNHTNDVHVFDTTKKTWRKPNVHGNPPSPRDSHTCTTVGNKIFMFGGTNGIDPLQDLYILDTSSNTWTSPSLRGEGPEAREGHTAALVGKNLYIFGGSGIEHDSTEVYYNDLHILDTETLEWRPAVTCGKPPSPRESHSCSVWKNNIIVVAGVDTSGHHLSDVHILDTDTLVWLELGTSGQMLSPRAGHSTIALGRNLFVLGGFTESRSLYDDLHMLYLETGIWMKVLAVGQGPSGRFSVAGDCLDAQKGILVFIGGCDVYLEALDDMYYLHIDMSMENGQEEYRLEKSSFKKELKRQCQEVSVHSPVSLPPNNTDVVNVGTVSDKTVTGPLQSSCHAGLSLSELARKKGKRGPTRSKLSTNGTKIILSTNEYGIPNEGNADHKTFISTIGVLTRTHIPIIYKSFRHVPEEYKQKILDILSESYEFEGIGGLGVDFVKYCMNSDWKAYKSNLHMMYIKDQDPTVVKEGPVPRDIPPDHWHKFVDYCNSAEFKAISARNKNNRGKLTTTTTLGRRSIAVVRHDIAVAKKLKSDSEVSRSEVYIKSHTKKDGTVLCPKVVSKIMEIESLDPDSRVLSENDSLTKAIGEDRGGRMRGLSGFISRSLVKKARLMVKKNEAMLNEKDSMSSDVLELKQGYQQLTKTVEELKAIVMATQQGETRVDTPQQEITRVDTALPSFPANQPSPSEVDSGLSLVGNQCILHGWAHRVVAHGLVDAIDPKLIVHGKPLGEGNFKVSLTEVVDSTCLLWVPDGYHNTISEVGVGGSIVWPRFLIELNS